MNFDVDENTPKKFRTDVCLVDTETGRVFSDNLRMIYLMLPLLLRRRMNVKLILNVGYLF